MVLTYLHFRIFHYKWSWSIAMLVYQRVPTTVGWNLLVEGSWRSPIDLMVYSTCSRLLQFWNMRPKKTEVRSTKNPSSPCWKGMERDGKGWKGQMQLKWWLTTVGVPSGKRLHDYGKIHHFYIMDKSTISTGPFSSSQTVHLPGRVCWRNRLKLGRMKPRQA